jgi:outer membrane immunogenic protein
MKKFLLAAVAGIGISTTATAADMRVKAPIAPPVVVYNWTGFYVGGNVGGAWGESRTDSPIANVGGGFEYIASVIADINAQRFQTVTGSGFTGGLQAGYNWQAKNFVFGVEADINAFNLSGTTTTSA